MTRLEHDLALSLREVRRLWREHVRHSNACALNRAIHPTDPCTCRVGEVADRADAALRRYREEPPADSDKP